MPFKVKVVTGGLGAAKVVKSLNDLTQRQVYVGVPEKTNDRDERLLKRISRLKKGGKRYKQLVSKFLHNEVNNAQLAFIHTYGSPLMNIPPRPIIEPAIEARGNKEKIQEQLKLAAKAALEGKPGEVKTRMRLAGMLAQNIVRGWFTDPRNNWAPNAASTIRRKGSNKPLIDTAEFRKSITYVVTN